MAKSQSIRFTDAQAMMQLVGECRELGDDPVVWRRHCGAGVGRMVGGELVLSAEVNGCLGRRMRMPGGTAVGFENGFKVEGYLRFGQMFAEDANLEACEMRSETFGGMIEYVRTRSPQGATLPHHRFVSGREWLRSFDYELARSMNSGAFVQSLCATDKTRDEFDGMTIIRSPGETDFDEQEVALVHLVHNEVARLVGGPLARYDEPSPSQLPPRVRQVLRCLLEGDGDKQVAARLQISQHTVNQYTKQIYRHFGVLGRTELLARWVRRGWGSKANWDAASVAPKLLVFD